MNINEAYAAVSFYNRNDLWRALEKMFSDWDNLDIYDKTAYRMVKDKLEKEMTNGKD